MRSVRGGGAAAVAATVASALLQDARALRCVTQLDTDPEEWTYEECSTFCIIAFADTTLLPEFEQPEPICSGAGCAVLDEDGKVDWSKSVIRSGDFPADGEVVTFKCDNSTFTKYPSSLESTLESGEPCNLYRDWTSPTQRCQFLPDAAELDSLTVEASFFQKNKFVVVLAICLFIALGALLAGWLFYRHRVADKRKNRVGGKLPDGDGSPDLEISPAAGAGDSQKVFIDPESSPDTRQVALSSVSLINDSDVESSTLPAHLAPGSAAYEMYHKALTSIYKDADQDVSRVDNVLQQYLSRPNGMELLNKKLKLKFGKQLRKFKPPTEVKEAPTTSQSFF